MLVDYQSVYLTEIAPRKGKIYFFIDEIQYADKWQHIIKRYYDTDSRIKFIIK
jgi:predicted AAA+ superfamily ATPase